MGPGKPVFVVVFIEENCVGDIGIDFLGSCWTVSWNWADKKLAGKESEQYCINNKGVNKKSGKVEGRDTGKFVKEVTGCAISISLWNLSVIWKVESWN